MPEGDDCEIEEEIDISSDSITEPDVQRCDTF